MTALLCAVCFAGGVLLGYWRGWRDRQARDSVAIKFAYDCWKIAQREER